MLALPFALQWSLGGFVAASAVGLWALISPLGAMMFGARALPWFGGFLALLGISALLEVGLTPAQVPAPVRLAFFVLNLGAPSLTVFVLLRYFLRKLQVERARSESLLLNVLPTPIAERLKDGEHKIADIGEATVLFADIVGFTTLAGERAPQQVVDLLNDVFTWLDTVADRFKVEKIKTIGDAYMAVAGLPTPRADHATAIAEMALVLVRTMPQFSHGDGETLQMRAGIDTGPVVAGVIGRRKFSYDLWGDTVNTASRMESTGVPGRIQVTERVVEALGDRYVFEPRGETEVKGKGLMRTWFLVGQDGRAEQAVGAQPAGAEDVV
jgi:class 3 adenylate cyclase